MWMVLLSTVDVSSLLICGNILSSLLNLKMIFKTLQTGIETGLLISMVGKLNFLNFVVQLVPVLLISKNERVRLC